MNTAPPGSETLAESPSDLLRVDGNLLEYEGEDPLGAGQQQVVLRQQGLANPQRVLRVLPRILPSGRLIH